MKQTTIVISDIHMATNDATNWYHRKTNADPTPDHEGFLEEILLQIISSKEVYEELIILGDLFDFWTCPPDEAPPSAQAIIDANPKILGPTGLMSQVLDALDGKVSYVRGNHDITTTQDDLNKIGTSSKHRIKMQPDIYVKGEVVYTHGHLSTLFNAPDNVLSVTPPLPVGHFVTRAISYMLKNKHKKAYTEPGFGALELQEKINKYIDRELDKLKPWNLKDPFAPSTYDVLRNLSVSNALLEATQEATGIEDDTTINLNGEKKIGFEYATTVYEYIYNLWISCYARCDHDLEGGPGAIDPMDTNNLNKLKEGKSQLNHLKQIFQPGKIARGVAFATKATYADKDGTYLGWFAQKMALENNAKLVVMGHTHSPRKWVNYGIIDYLNTGFDCVPAPDIAQDKMTFGIIKTAPDGKYIESKVMAIEHLNNKFQTSEFRAKKAKIFEDVDKDFSSYVTVENQSNEDYVLDSFDDVHGYYVVLPPKLIPKGESRTFWMQDFPGIAGTEGKVIYRGKVSGQQVPLHFRCTNIGAGFYNGNDCYGTNEFYSTNKRQKFHWELWDGLKKNKIERDRHPFFAKFVLQKQNGNRFKQHGKWLFAQDGTCLKPGEMLHLENGSTDLSGIITGSGNAKVFSIKWERDTKSDSIHNYNLRTVGMGPKLRIGIDFADAFYLKVYDKDMKEICEESYIKHEKSNYDQGVITDIEFPYIYAVSWND